MIKHLLRLVFLIIIFFLLASSQTFGQEIKTTSIPSYSMDNRSTENNDMQIISLKMVPEEGILPIICTFYEDNGDFKKFFSAELPVISESLTNLPIIKVNFGSGSVFADYSSDNDFNINIFNVTKSVIVRQNWPVKICEPVLSQSEVWDKEYIMHIQSDLTIPEGITLDIKEGCRIIIDEDANIFVYGKLTVEGTSDEPVFFTNADSELSWGGIKIQNQTNISSLSHTIFVGGGGNEDYVFGHSASQPVVFSYFSNVDFLKCCFIQNEGKAIGGVNSKITINSCIFSKCDTGAEFQSCYVVVDRSHFSYMPDADGIANDDDNDCLYFYHFLNTMGDEPSVVIKSVLCYGEDDAIDHNEAKLSVENCLINGFEHEGIAASAGNFVNTFNCLIMNCEQGIEAGYGQPQVKINHCTILNSSVGIRFGDSYFSGCSGNIQVENSICFNNIDNLLNFDLLTQDSVTNAISISYSITNDDYYDNYQNCFSATPLFLPDYFLQDFSPGVNMASDSCDIGLYRCNFGNSIQTHQNSDFSVFPNPNSGFLKIVPLKKNGDEFFLRIFNYDGKIIFDEKYFYTNKVIEIDISSIIFHSGIILLCIKDRNENRNWYKVVIKR